VFAFSLLLLRSNDFTLYDFTHSCNMRAKKIYNQLLNWVFVVETVSAYFDKQKHSVRS
jgi:hypothetical protein